tara:strand:- start:227 stop:427 length:201 start_codon:yes stop_codon:yes gene_type:complete
MSNGIKKKKPGQVIDIPKKGVANKNNKKKVPEISSYGEVPAKIKMVLRKKKKKKEDGDNTSEAGLY